MSKRCDNGLSRAPYKAILNKHAKNNVQWPVLCERYNVQFSKNIVMGNALSADPGGSKYTMKTL